MDGHVEEDAVLRNGRDVLAGPVGVKVSNILFVETNHTLLQVVHAQKKLSNSRLARAASTDDECGLTSRKEDTDIAQDGHGGTRRVGEGDINELKSTAAA